MKISKSKTRRILEELQHNTCTAKEMFEAMFPPDTFKVTKRLLGYMTPPKKLTYRELKRLEQKRFYSLLAKLRVEGFIRKRGIGLAAAWHLTAHGLQKLLRQPAQQGRHPEIPRNIYQKKKISDKIIIIFDIPESLKHYRNWIRHQLRSLGFDMLQKSVWVGTYQIPADFIHDLRECNVLRYIHIFKVTNPGSIC